MAARLRIEESFLANSVQGIIPLVSSLISHFRPARMSQLWNRIMWEFSRSRRVALNFSRSIGDNVEHSITFSVTFLRWRGV